MNLAVMTGRFSLKEGVGISYPKLYLSFCAYVKDDKKPPYQLEA